MAEDVKLYEAPALDMPGIGRLTLAARKPDAVMLEAQAFIDQIVIIRFTAALTRPDCRELLQKRLLFPEAMYLYDGERQIGYWKPPSVDAVNKGRTGLIFTPTP